MNSRLLQAGLPLKDYENATEQAEWFTFIVSALYLRTKRK